MNIGIARHKPSTRVPANESGSCKIAAAAVELHGGAGTRVLTLFGLLPVTLAGSDLFVAEPADADEALTQALSSIRELRRIHDRAHSEREEQPDDE